MLKVRKAADRGRTQLDWLDGRHTFSFGDYYDPEHHHYRSLRVINDDRVAPGGGFGMHPHRDMEILTYILSGALQHRDSMGNGSVIRAGDWQKMSAGTGVLHSEFNASTAEPVHLLQIWIVPDQKGLAPGYGERRFPDAAPGAWRVVASKDGRDDSIVVHQDVVLSSARLRAGDRVAYELTKGRGAWLHVATGAATVNGAHLEAGDAVAVEDESKVEVVGEVDGEVLLFDLA